MNVSAFVLFRVVNELVDIVLVQPGVGRQFIGIEFRAACNVLAHMFLQSLVSATLYVGNVDLTALAIQQFYHQLFAVIGRIGGRVSSGYAKVIKNISENN